MEAVRWAPNHRNTEPWRIFVLERGGAKRNEIADLVAQWTYDSIKNPAPGRREDSAEAARQEIHDAPSFIYVYSVPGPTEEVTTENYAATCCAVQNMQLAAYAHGVAVGWSTGKPTKPERLADSTRRRPDVDDSRSAIRRISKDRSTGRTALLRPNTHAGTSAENQALPAIGLMSSEL